MGKGARAARGALAVACVSGAYAGALLALRPGYPASADSHYHFSVGREIAGGTWVPDVARGLPLTVLQDMPVDHYWGYHLLLAPFGLVPDPELGMAIATAVLFAGVAVATYLFLAARGVVHAWIWALLPMLFSTQDWRFLQLRGGQLIVPLLFALAEVAFFEARVSRRRAGLLAIAYVAMLSYHGGLVLLAFHAGGVAALALLRPLEGWPRLLDPAWTAAGLAFGLTLNPYMDARASTWRFALFHIGRMGQDRAHLYDDQEIAEFHGFPARVLAVHPEWLLLLLTVAFAIAFVVWKARTAPTEVGTEAIVLAGMALAGIALTAQAMRTREYSVPIAFAFLAVLAPRQAPGFAPTAIAAALLGLALEAHAAATLPLLGHLPTRQYEGARALLEANGQRPILNVAEADYGLLRWQYPRVVCVQGLSRYFIYPYPTLFHDVWEVHDHADTSPETPAILRRFWDRGVRLVAAHETHALTRFAAAHPRMLRRVFRSNINGAAIYAIERDALDQELPP